MYFSQHCVYTSYSVHCMYFSQHCVYTSYSVHCMYFSQHCVYSGGVYTGYKACSFSYSTHT